MSRHAPPLGTGTHRRVLPALLSLLTGLLLIGSIGAADGCTAAYPIVIGSDEDTLIVRPGQPVAGGHAVSPDQPATHEPACRLYVDVFNAADPDVAAALITDDAVIQTHFGTYLGPDGLLDYIAFVKRTYPDADFTVTNVTTRDDTVEVSWLMTATRIVVNPVEQPLNARVEITGSSTITAERSRITGLSITTGRVLISAPSAETA